MIYHRRHTLDGFLIIALIFLQLGYHQCLTSVDLRARDNLNVPCNYLDSLNITDMSPVSSNVVLLDHKRFSADRIGIYDYEIVNETFRRPAKRHRRQCVCDSRPCVRLLCPRGMDYVNGQCVADERLLQLNISVQTVDGQTSSVDMFEHFGYTVGRVCNEMTPLDPEQFPTDLWILHENGTITTMSKMVLSQHEYCLMPQVNEKTSNVEFTAIYCLVDAAESVDIRYTILPRGMLLSVPFLVLTFLVYAILPELRNVHGKSLMCYLAGLANGYAVLSYVQINPSTDNPWCRPLGYLLYFWFMTAFFWLNVISFDLWWNFRHFVAIIRGMPGNSKHDEKRKFLLYSAYAWCVPLSVVLICYALDSTPGVPSYVQPGFGLIRCFLKNNVWIEFVYFYLPIMCIFVANAIFFTLTALKIRRVQMEMARMTSKEDSKRHKSQFEREKNKYGLFLRLFIVMGVTWSMEVMSWLIDPTGWPFYISDAMNCVQGVVIFFLFIVKPKVKQLLIKRWHVWRGTEQQGISHSGHTTTSQISRVVARQSAKSTETKNGILPASKPSQQ